MKIGAEADIFVAQTPPPIVVAGTRARDGERRLDVLVLARGEHGEFAQGVLSAGEARKLAIDLNAMADLCEGGWHG